MSGSECVTPGIFSDFHFDIQVGDTHHRSESIAAHGLQLFNLSFNRTVVILLVLLFTGILGAVMSPLVIFAARTIESIFGLY
jgi:hypothetical protein